MERDKDTCINMDRNTSDARPTAVAFVNCFDATTYGRVAHPTAEEARRLRKLLAAVHDYGFILAASIEPALPGYGFGDVIDHLCATIGAHRRRRAGGGRARRARNRAPPTAVMPGWALEPENGGGDVLLSSANLWGTNLLVEVLRIEDDDDPTPVPSVRDRFRR